MSTATLPTEGDADDYVIVLNGDPIEWLDAGGRDSESYVEGYGKLDGEEAEVRVGCSSDGVSGVSLVSPKTDEVHSLTQKSHKTHRFLEFYAEDVPGVSACVELLPESEVSA